MPTDPTPAITSGEIAYRAYGDNRGWKTANGGDMPRWEAQRPELCAAWEEAATAVGKHLVERAAIAAERAREVPAPADPKWRELDSAAAHGGRDYATIRIAAMGELGAGGAPHTYDLMWTDIFGHAKLTVLSFQTGPIQEVGINGITHEALLAVIIDRLEHFQRGPYPCVENECALRHARASLEWLNTRTHKRELRGVEGRNEA